MLGEFISAGQYIELLARGRREVAPLLKFDPETLKSCYNRKPFLVEHSLADHAYFSLDRLFALCRRMDPVHILYRIGNIPRDAELESSFSRYNKGLTLEETLDHFEEKKAYICINNPERDAEYRPVIEGLLAEIAAQVHPLDPQMSWYSTYIFISTQGSITPYHMDREMNFLLQIQGSKTVYLWDQSDGEIMTSEQKDLLLAHVGSRPVYKPSFESKAMSFGLEPGLGVHHPFIAPHRVHTGAELSISLAVTFRTRQSDTLTDAHRFNTRMRKLGLHPIPVGSSRLLDRAKSGVARVGQHVHRRLAMVDEDVTS
ncbi:MAG: cupin-like domain-containing protein [Rhodanobacter sp.]